VGPDQQNATEPSPWGRPAGTRGGGGLTTHYNRNVLDDKEQRQLRHVEAKLLDRLRRLLPAVVAGRGTDVFINSEFDPHDYAAAGWRSSEPEELLRLAREAQALRRDLGMPNDGPGYLFLQACAECADLGDHHRLGPRRLAERLLKELDKDPG
jgi:hypothetical protein